MSEKVFGDGQVVPLQVDLFTDNRGSLAALNLLMHDFLAVRAFVVTAPQGAVRGEHGHVRGRQILMRLSGEIEVETVHRGERACLLLDADTPAVLIEAPVWSRQTYRGARSSLLVLCDTPYDPDGYILQPESKVAQHEG